MHKGTLISDLMATVERVELRGERSAARSSEQRRIFDELELSRTCGLQSTAKQHERVFMGAA